MPALLASSGELKARSKSLKPAFYTAFGASRGGIFLYIYGGFGAPACDP